MKELKMISRESRDVKEAKQTRTITRLEDEDGNEYFYKSSTRLHADIFKDKIDVINLQVALMHLEGAVETIAKELKK